MDELPWHVILGSGVGALLGFLSHIIVARWQITPPGWLQTYFDDQQPVWKRNFSLGTLPGAIMFALWSIAGLLAKISSSQILEDAAGVLFLLSFIPMFFVIKWCFYPIPDWAKPAWLLREERRRSRDIASRQSEHHGNGEASFYRWDFLDGITKEYSGSGSRTLRIPGVLPRPIILELSHTGDGQLAVYWKLVRFSFVWKLAELRGNSNFRIIYDDDDISGGTGGYTVRYLRIRAKGSWTVKLRGPEACRTLSAHTEGRGFDVLSCNETQGAATVRWDGNGPFWMNIRRPDMILQTSRRTKVLRKRNRSVESDRAGSWTFEIFKDMVLEVGAHPDSAWTIDVQ